MSANDQVESRVSTYSGRPATPMRVGINALLLWGRHSGVEQAIWGLIKALAGWDGFNEYAVYIPRGFRPGAAVECPGLTFQFLPTRVPSRFRSLRIAAEQFGFPRILLRDDIDVFHCPGYVMPLRSPVPTIVSIYDVLALSHPHLCRPANRWHYGRMLPESAKRAARIITPSQTVKRDLLQCVDVSDRKVRVVPLGVDERFKPVVDSATLQRVQGLYGVPERFMLFVGNIEPKKNLKTLLVAYEKIGRRGIRQGLVIAGAKVWDKASLVQARRVGAQFIGYVPDDDLPALYSLADAFVFPSFYEGFGLAPLEAMACGTPVVASDAGALPEVLRDAALFVEPTDADALANAIVRIVEDRELRDGLIEKGKARAERYSWVQTAKIIVSLYRRVFEESL